MSGESSSTPRPRRAPATRLPRFRLRTLLVVVAVAALVLWGERTYRRWHTYREKVAYNAWNESGSRAYANDARGVSGGEDRVERGDTLASHHARLRRKYERAAARPWLPVEPDPPQP